MKAQFSCPNGDYIAKVELQGSQTWQCPACDHLVELKEPKVTDTEGGPIISHCAACGNHELYKMKGFPHWLGLSLLAAACLAFLILHGYYKPYWAWGVLLGSFFVDLFLYLMVSDVIVCYRCRARHSGLGRVGHEPFELTIHERYRQEQARPENPTP